MSHEDYKANILNRKKKKTQIRLDSQSTSNWNVVYMELWEASLRGWKVRECLKMGDEAGACWGMKNVPERINVRAQADEPPAQAYNSGPDRQ